MEPETLQRRSAATIRNMGIEISPKHRRERSLFRFRCKYLLANCFCLSCPRRSNRWEINHLTCSTECTGYQPRTAYRRSETRPVRWTTIVHRFRVSLILSKKHFPYSLVLSSSRLNPASTVTNWESQANYSCPTIVHRPPNTEYIQLAEQILQSTPPITIIQHPPVSATAKLSRHTLTRKKTVSSLDVSLFRSRSQTIGQRRSEVRWYSECYSPSTIEQFNETDFESIQYHRYEWYVCFESKPLTSTIESVSEYFRYQRGPSCSRETTCKA